MYGACTLHELELLGLGPGQVATPVPLHAMYMFLAWAHIE